MPKPVRRFIDGAYGQIHLRFAAPQLAPAAPPLHCLHMSPKSGRSFAAFMTSASEDRVVVAPDYPGYGESDPPPEEPPVRIEDYARECWRVADALGHARIDLFGAHTGGKVALEMAHQAPQRVRAIVIVSAALFTPQERAAFEALYAPIPLDEAGSRFSALWARIVAHRGPGMTLEMMATALAENLRGGERYEWGHRAAFAHGPRFEALMRAASHPLCVLNPADELQAHTRRAAAIAKHVRVIERPDWGHGFLDASADEAAALVRRTLDQSAGEHDAGALHP